METEIKKVTIVIPVYNEAVALKDFIPSVEGMLKQQNGWEALLIDDGSTDGGCKQIENSPSFKIIRHPARLGYGAAVKTGLKNAHGEFVALMDGDGQHDPNQLLKLIEALKDNDLVVGSRSDHDSLFRKLGLFFLNPLASYLSGEKIADLTSGFRIYRRSKVIEFMHLFPNGFSASATGTLAFAVSGSPITFVPVEVHPRKLGKSKINFFEDGIKFCGLVLKIVSLFNPLKFFLPISVILFLLGLVWTAKTVYFANATSPLGMAFFLASFLSFTYGLLADQISSVLMTLGKILSCLEKK